MDSLGFTAPPAKDFSELRQLVWEP